MIEAQRHQQQPTELPVTSDALRRLQLALEAQIVAAGAAGVLLFNGRSGNVSLVAGDVTGALGYTPLASVPAGSVGPTELVSTAVTPGSYTNTDLTVDADGRIIAASSGSAGTSYTDEQAQDAVGGILTDTPTIDLSYNDGANTISADVKAGSIGPTELAATAVTPGTYGNATNAPQLVIDADGRVTSATNVPIPSGNNLVVVPIQLPTAHAVAVNSLTYVQNGILLNFYLDRDEFPATEYRIVLRGNSNAAGATVTAQLTQFGAPTVPLHTGGDDVLITDTLNTFDSGWLSLDDGGTGLDYLALALKGSTVTVDLSVSGGAIMFRR